MTRRVQHLLEAVASGKSAAAVLREAIDGDTKAPFLYIQVPEALHAALAVIAQRVPQKLEDENSDHVTLLWVPDFSDDFGAHAAIQALRRVGRAVEPFTAKVQGWAFFDRVRTRESDQEATALVALLDAPALSRLHHMVREALGETGWPTDQQTHSYVPHITLAYLEHGARYNDLPVMDYEFNVGMFSVAWRGIRSIPLGG